MKVKKSIRQWLLLERNRKSHTDERVNSIVPHKYPKCVCNYQWTSKCIKYKFTKLKKKWKNPDHYWTFYHFSVSIVDRIGRHEFNKYIEYFNNDNA